MYCVELNNKNYLYVMTTRRVTLVKVQECQQFRTCGECLGARDPYCGWCSLENKCSLRSDCAEAAQDPLYWLSYKSGKCTTITHVHPPQIQRTTARTVSIVSSMDSLFEINCQTIIFFYSLPLFLIFVDSLYSSFRCLCLSLYISIAYLVLIYINS